MSVLAGICSLPARAVGTASEDQQAVVTDERGGIRVGCRPNRGVVEIPDLGTALTVGDEASQRALPRLPSPARSEEESAAVYRTRAAESYGDQPGGLNALEPRSTSRATR